MPARPGTFWVLCSKTSGEGWSPQRWFGAETRDHHPSRHTARQMVHTICIQQGTGKTGQTWFCCHTVTPFDISVSLKLLCFNLSFISQSCFITSLNFKLKGACKHSIMYQSTACMHTPAPALSSSTARESTSQAKHINHPPNCKQGDLFPALPQL